MSGVAVTTRGLRRLVSWLGWRALRDRRGSVAVIAAVSMMPLLIAAGVAVDMSRLTDARAALQRAADNAALSGAAAYVTYAKGDGLKPVARATAQSAFCNAVTALPGGFVLGSPAGSTACSGQAAGPTVTAVIDGFNVGTRGTAARSGGSSTNPAPSQDTSVICGFIVTVAATATANTMFPFLLGGLATVSVTASAINPFIRLNNAISAKLNADAYNANSLWIYPLLLDADGVPDFSTNVGALPDASACTGNPTQTACGSYTMLASNYFQKTCPADKTCSSGGTTFLNGVVQNPDTTNTAVITATTPLGIALQSAAGVLGSFGYKTPGRNDPKPDDAGCYWPNTLDYNTVGQWFDVNGYPLLTDGNGNWTVVTHWFYSSYLANNLPPDQKEIAAQTPGATQVVPAIPPTPNPTFKPNASPAPTLCPKPTSTSNPANAEPGMATRFFIYVSTNCALYIAKDPGSMVPQSGGGCWSPANTPGYQYAALSCQNFAGHTFAFFWNDMSGLTDDKDYGDGTLAVSCSGASYVMLIN